MKRAEVAAGDTPSLTSRESFARLGLRKEGGNGESKPSHDGQS
jgi:hypothetical protein